MRIGATAYNKFVDAAVAVSERQFKGVPPKVTLSSGHVWVRNEGTTDLTAFTPLRITGVDSTCVVRRDPKIVFEVAGGGSATPSSNEAFVVLQEPLRRGTIGVAAISGWTYAKVNRPSSTTQWAPGTRLSLGIGVLRPQSDGSAIVCGGGIALDSTSSIHPVKLGVGGGAFYAKIRANPTQDGTAARWLYGFDEASLDAANVEWDNITAGRTSDSLGTALNLLEAPNTASSGYSIPVAGNDFTIGNTGVRFRPVPAGTVVRMHLVQASDPQLVAVFSAPNPVWGPCNALSALSDEYGSDAIPSNSLGPEAESEETS
jgi:hypothetical protein